METKALFLEIKLFVKHRSSSSVESSNDHGFWFLIVPLKSVFDDFLFQNI